MTASEAAALGWRLRLVFEATDWHPFEKTDTKQTMATPAIRGKRGLFRRSGRVSTAITLNCRWLSARRRNA